MLKTAISRRAMLRSAGVGLGLPLLNAMVPALARAQATAAPRRMLAICNNLGLLPGEFFPADAGRKYTPSNYLKLLQDYRSDFTVFSGVSHPNVDGGHPSDISFLTAAPHPASSSFRKTISLDQYIAERVGNQTRFPSLTLAVNTGGRSLSWTGNGVAIPPEQSGRCFPADVCPRQPERGRSQDRGTRYRPIHSRRGLRPGSGSRAERGRR
jgi:Protein of unknown function (DUF1552)